MKVKQITFTVYDNNEVDDVFLQVAKYLKNGYNIDSIQTYPNGCSATVYNTKPLFCISIERIGQNEY